jgi:hypothetical protein
MVLGIYESQEDISKTYMQQCTTNVPSEVHLYGVLMVAMPSKDWASACFLHTNLSKMPRLFVTAGTL